MKKGRSTCSMIGLIDTNAPISMDMRRMITGNLTKKEKFTHSEHQLNLQS